ncbi:MAG: hypothetical protein M1840_004691 [Geoglossum simile]|nr:MAG: hypothetical protein M1840_004691 [Geoglossum simile]
MSMAILSLLRQNHSIRQNLLMRASSRVPPDRGMMDNAESAENMMDGGDSGTEDELKAMYGLRLEELEEQTEEQTEEEKDTD